MKIYLCQKNAENKKCVDFEVRFCCSTVYQSEELTERPEFNESRDLEQLNHINDLRKWMSDII